MPPEVGSDMRWLEGHAPPSILQAGHPLLQRAAREVHGDDWKSIKALGEYLLARLREENAQGIAAPQLGIDLCLAAIETRPKALAPDVQQSKPYVLVNPQIIRRSRARSERYEGCLSVLKGDLLGLVPRANRVEVVYFDVAHRQHREVFTSYLARVVQHEIDHLAGWLFLQRVPWRRGAYVCATRENFARYILAKGL